jgi:hypothetical protein
MKRKTSNRTKDTRFTSKWATFPAAVEATRHDPSDVYLADSISASTSDWNSCAKKLSRAAARRHFVL